MEDICALFHSRVDERLATLAIILHTLIREGVRPPVHARGVMPGVCVHKYRADVIFELMLLTDLTRSSRATCTQNVDQMIHWAPLP